MFLPHAEVAAGRIVDCQALVQRSVGGHIFPCSGVHLHMYVHCFLDLVISQLLAVCARELC